MANIAVVVKPLAAFDIEAYNDGELIYATHFSGTEEEAKDYQAGLYEWLTGPDAPEELKEEQE